MLSRMCQALDSVPTRAEERGNGNFKTYFLKDMYRDVENLASVLHSISNSLSLDSVLLTAKIQVIQDKI